MAKRFDPSVKPTKEQLEDFDQETFDVIARQASGPGKSVPNDRETESPPAADAPDAESAAEPIAPEDDPTWSPEQRELRRLSKRPRIDHLEPAVVVSEVDGVETLVPLFIEGDRIVADRCSEYLLNSAWLDTRVLRVQAIDDDTGVVRCRDEELEQLTYVSFKSALHDLRLCPPRGNPFTAPKVRQQKQEGLPNTEGKRGRGRPKGSKNRPKDVVAAEKAERKQQRMSEPRRRRVKKQ